MDALILFVLKSIVVSGLLCAWYMLALKNRRLHNYNRAFLLLTLYASIQVPLLHFTWSPAYEGTQVIGTSTQVLLQTLSGADELPTATRVLSYTGIDWKAIGIALSALVSLGLLTTMIVRIAQVVRLGRQYPHTIVDGVTLLHTDLPKAPFTFMNRIFWRDSISPDTNIGRMILQHELVHVRQKHTYDKLACQALTCIFWMNPFYWLIQRELSIVHEFIADEKAIVDGSAGSEEEGYTAVFARMMLQVHNRAALLNPEHQFFASPIKRRLTMLQTNKKVRASVIRRAAVLPLIGISLLIFAFSPQGARKSAVLKADKKIVLVVDAGHGGKDAGARWGSLAEKDLNLKVAKRIAQLAPDYNIEVHLTRSTDKDVTLQERVAFSNGLRPDDFLSIHVDTQPGGETDKGTFDIAINNKSGKAAESQRLAYAIFRSASRPEWERKPAPSEKNAYVLRENAAPAALIEIGNIKNKDQMQHIEDDAKLSELCSHILEGVVEAHKG
jgi:N-acetylmuramoyl-L-alanine amidase